MQNNKITESFYLNLKWSTPGMELTGWLVLKVHFLKVSFSGIEFKLSCALNQGAFAKA